MEVYKNETFASYNTSCPFLIEVADSQDIGCQKAQEQLAAWFSMSAINWAPITFSVLILKMKTDYTKSSLRSNQLKRNTEAESQNASSHRF